MTQCQTGYNVSYPLDWHYVLMTSVLVALYEHHLCYLSTQGDRGSTAFKVLCYKSEGRWFDPSWRHWNFSLTKSFRSHYGPGVDSASDRNEYQEHFLGVKAAGA